MYLCVPLDPVLEADLTGEGMTLQEVLDAVTAAREAAAAAAEADESRKAKGRCPAGSVLCCVFRCYFLL